MTQVESVLPKSVWHAFQTVCAILCWFSMSLVRISREREHRTDLWSEDRDAWHAQSCRWRAGGAGKRLLAWLFHHLEESDPQWASEDQTRPKELSQERSAPRTAWSNDEDVMHWRSVPAVHKHHQNNSRESEFSFFRGRRFLGQIKTW